MIWLVVIPSYTPNRLECFFAFPSITGVLGSMIMELRLQAISKVVAPIPVIFL